MYTAGSGEAGAAQPEPGVLGRRAADQPKLYGERDIEADRERAGRDRRVSILDDGAWVCYEGDGRSNGLLHAERRDMVFAVTADMQDEPGKIGWVEEQFYTSILPCVQERECVGDPEGEAALRRYCQTLCVRPHRGEVQSPWMDRVSGKTYRMIPNEEGTWSSLHLQEVSLRFERKERKSDLGRTYPAVWFGIL